MSKLIVFEVRFCLGFHGNRDVSSAYVFGIPEALVSRRQELIKQIEPWAPEGHESHSLSMLADRVAAGSKLWKNDTTEKSQTMTHSDGTFIRKTLIWRKNTAWEGFDMKNKTAVAPPKSDEIANEILSNLKQAFGDDILMEHFSKGIDIAGNTGIRGIVSRMEALLLKRGRIESCQPKTATKGI